MEHQVEKENLSLLNLRINLAAAHRPLHLCLIPMLFLS